MKKNSVFYDFYDNFKIWKNLVVKKIDLLQLSEDVSKKEQPKVRNGLNVE